MPHGDAGARPATVAVGASAGGVEALKRLLGALNPDANLAVVVVQHLSPTHGSLLTSALGGTSRLPVVEVRDGMAVSPGQVHVIPPNTTLVMDGERLRLRPREESARPPMPIDVFMRSLAAERGAAAIGIVLSGTGSDGTDGLRAIRTAGGRTYAQEPSTAVHDAMPRSAIAADVVDLILAPEGIAADLAALARGAGAPSDAEEAPAAGDLGRAISDLRPNIDAPELDAWIAEVIETAAVKEAEVRDADGHWQRLQIRPYQTANRRIDGAVVSLVEVDALKTAVTEARRARDFVAAVLETVPVPVLVLDAAMRVTSANRAFHEVFRVSPEATAGKPLDGLGAGPWRSGELAGWLRDGIARGVPFQDVEVEYDLDSGGRRIAVVAGRPVADTPEANRSLVLAIQDVTELRRIEEERARARTEQAQRFLNEAGAAMLPESLDYDATLAALAHLIVPRLADWCIVDLVEPGGAIRQAAAAHVDPVKEQRARALRRQLPPEAQPDRGVAWVIRTGNATLHPEVEDLGWLAGALGVEHPELLRELGARSYLSVPLRGRKGVIGALSLVRGLPGRRFDETDLSVVQGLGQCAGLAVENARLYVAARDAVIARDDFLAIAAHELRTPLSTLSLQLQSLAAARGPELVEAVAAGKLERAMNQTRRLARLIDSLLEVSRITAGKLALQREQTDLSAIVRDVAQRQLAAAQAAGSTIRLDADRPVTGAWDPLRVDQVVSNLLQNAIRHAPGALIELSVKGDEGRARLAVRDHGPGIPSERRARIFERFEKGGGKSQEGLGIGLFITRQIVEAHGGAIRLEGESGAGTTFVVELPRGGAPGAGETA